MCLGPTAAAKSRVRKQKQGMSGNRQWCVQPRMPATRVQAAGHNLQQDTGGARKGDLGTLSSVSVLLCTPSLRAVAQQNSFTAL
jgi:hypothetical protein